MVAAEVVDWTTLIGISTCEEGYLLLLYVFSADGGKPLVRFVWIVVAADGGRY